MPMNSAPTITPFSAGLPINLHQGRMKKRGNCDSREKISMYEVRRGSVIIALSPVG